MPIYFRNIAILYIDFMDLNLGLLKRNLEKTLGVEIEHRFTSSMDYISDRYVRQLCWKSLLT
jgi:hypothetical protein